MTVLYAACASIIVGAAIYLILSRNLVRILLGLSMLSTGVNLALFIAGGLLSDQPPIIVESETRLAGSADPLAQALILTAIVIGFALTLILAAIVLRAWRARGELDSSIVDAHIPYQEIRPYQETPETEHGG